MSATYISMVFFSGSPRKDAGPVTDSTAPILMSANAGLAPSVASAKPAMTGKLAIARFIVPSATFMSLMRSAHGRRSARPGANPTKALFGAVGAVSGVAEARNDIGILVEMVVDRGGPQLDIRVDAEEPLEAFRRREQAGGTD